MFGVVGLVFALYYINGKSYAEEGLYYSNGWKPLTNEIVLENLSRKFTKTPDAIHLAAVHWNPIVYTEANVRHVEKKAIIEPYDINRELMYNDDIVNYEKQNQVMSEKDQNYNSDNLSNLETALIYEPNATHRRQAKNIIEKILNTNNLYSQKNKIDMNNSIIKEDSEIKETNVINSKSKFYEVTEASEASEIKDLLDINEGRADQQKPYFKPNIESKTENNLSNIFQNILSNYNIKINDDLMNYAISRNKHISNSRKQTYVYSSPTTIPSTWNSHNHLPLDPFLAVFLSNYGYYLPGFYGFPGNYYNIYGYLASNNIHNNKPFGAYKIYSDTDSSH